MCGSGKKDSAYFDSGFKDDFCPDGNKTGQFNAFIVVHSYTASGDAFTDFTLVVVAVDPVKTAARRTMRDVNFKCSHKIQWMTRRHHRRKIDSLFFESGSGDRWRIPFGVELDFCNPSRSHRLRFQTFHRGCHVVFPDKG